MNFGWGGKPLPQTASDIAFLLSIEEKKLLHLLTRIERHSNQKAIPKPGGQTRSLQIPSATLKLLLNQTCRWLNNYEPHKAAHGWRRGGSTLSCAMPHVGSRLVIRIDIENFFPSIPYSRVRKTLEHLGWGVEAAEILTKLTTINGCLPTGFSTSPMLANLVFIRQDARITGLCDKLNYRYTRYGDDLIISGSGDRRDYIIRQVREILGEEGYSVNETKFKKNGIRFNTQRQEAVGIVLNRKYRLPSEKLDEYAQNIQDWKDAKELDVCSLPQIQGQISYTYSICPKSGKILKSLLGS